MDAAVFKDATTRAARTLARKGDDLEIVFAGTGAGANGKAIILPALANGATIEDAQADVMRGYADHETLHHRMSCLDDKEVVDRILSQPKRVHRVSNALEDMRIEQVGVKLYPGMRNTLRAVVEATAKRALETVPDDAYWSDIKSMAAVGITWLGRIKMGTAGQYTNEAYGKLSPEIKQFCERALGRLAAEVEPCLKAGKIVQAASRRAAMQVMDLGAELAAEIGEIAKAQQQPQPEPQPQPQPEPQQQPEPDEQEEPDNEPQAQPDEEEEAGQPEPDDEEENGLDPDAGGGTVEDEDEELEPDDEAQSSSEPLDEDYEDDELEEDDGVGTSHAGNEEPDDDAEAKMGNGNGNSQNGQREGMGNGGGNGGNNEEEAEPDDLDDDQMLDAEVDDTVKEMAKDINAKAGAANGGRTFVRITDKYDTVHSRDNPGGGKITEIYERDASLDEYYQTTLMHGVKNEVYTIKRKLERAIMAEDRRDYIAGQRSGRLNSARLADVMRGKPNVFRRAEEGCDMDTAVCLSVDMSGSMRGARIQLACQAATLLLDALDKVGAKSCITGFCSTGSSYTKSYFGKHFDKYETYDSLEAARKAEIGSTLSWVPCHHVIVKGWRERTADAAVTLSRLAFRDVFHGYTPLGFGVRQAAMELRQRTERRKVMIVLTDGIPETGDVGDHEVKLDAIDAVAEARKAGFDVVAIGIGLDVSGVFGEDASHYIGNANQLAEKCLDVIGQALLSGKARKAA